MRTVIGLDFDGTCVEHAFPEVGADIGAQPWLMQALELGARIVLNTMRDDERGPVKGNMMLTDAVRWFTFNEIPLYGINENPTQKHWSLSRKIYANVYVDDAALGVPLIHPPDRRPFVDWIKTGPELLRLIEARHA